MPGQYLIIDAWQKRTGAYGCWSGKDCVTCNGTGETVDAHACRDCGGTGETWQDIMPQITYSPNEDIAS